MPQDEELLAAYFERRMDAAPPAVQDVFMLSPHARQMIVLKIERDFWRERYMALIAVREG